MIVTDDRNTRTTGLIGDKGLDILRNSSVLIFGIGGVGGFTAESLARCGIGSFTFVDADTVEESNINRQITADYSTIGRYKTEVMKERALLINPECSVRTLEIFYTGKEAEPPLDFSEYDYVVDAVDTVASKTEIIVKCREKGIPVITSMGTGNKINNTGFRVTDIEDTSVCPLARVMRKELRKRGVSGVKAVWSDEKPVKSEDGTIGTLSYVPSTAGLVISGEVIRDLLRTGGIEL